MSKDSAFPTLSDEFIDTIVDMEYVTQSDYSWKEAPATAVLFACEVLKWLYSQEHQQNVVVAMAKEIIYQYGNWRSKELALASSVRQEMYQRNYEGEPWEEYYHQDGF